MFISIQFVILALAAGALAAPAPGDRGYQSSNDRYEIERDGHDDDFSSNNRFSTDINHGPPRPSYRGWTVPTDPALITQVLGEVNGAITQATQGALSGPLHQASLCAGLRRAAITADKAVKPFRNPKNGDIANPTIKATYDNIGQQLSSNNCPAVLQMHAN